MNYRHIYHAGNFADVLKHLTLIALFKDFQKKETPFTYIDTHSGAGLFNLCSEESKKTQEAENGIMRLMQDGMINKDNKNDNEKFAWFDIVQSYAKIIAREGFPKLYPGSPMIAYHLLREQDEAIFLEMHPEEYQHIKMVFNRIKDKKITIHKENGYLGLKAFLPPKTKRGIILIDPPFEEKNEWQTIIESLKIALKRFSVGVYAIWYPIKDMDAMEFFIEQLKMLKFPNLEILNIQLKLFPDDAQYGLRGCGMITINPPWKFAEKMQEMTAWIWEKLNINHAGSYSMDWLIGPK